MLRSSSTPVVGDEDHPPPYTRRCVSDLSLLQDLSSSATSTSAVLVLLNFQQTPVHSYGTKGVERLVVLYLSSS